MSKIKHTDPTAQTVQLIGMPKARLALAQATVHLATAPSRTR